MLSLSVRTCRLRLESDNREGGGGGGLLVMRCYFLGKELLEGMSGIELFKILDQML